MKKGAARAIVQTYWDGEKLGDTVKMKDTYVLNALKDTETAGEYRKIFIADLEFKETKEHGLKLKTVVAGQGNMDGIEFIPLN